MGATGTPQTIAAISPKAALTYWLEAYERQFGSQYGVSNWAKEMGHVKALLKRYSWPVLSGIMDVVLRLYVSRWATQRFTRPTLGALVSWLAAQAEPLALANIRARAAITEVPDSPDDGDESLLDKYVSRGWL